MVTCAVSTPCHCNGRYDRGDVSGSIAADARQGTRREPPPGTRFRWLVSSRHTSKRRGLTMSMFDEGRVIIRVAVNEMQPKGLNPRIPYGPEEVATEAIACAQVGASIVHFHSRTNDGAQATDDDRNGAGIYRRALELVALQSDIIM